MTKPLVQFADFLKDRRPHQQAKTGQPRHSHRLTEVSRLAGRCKRIQLFQSLVPGRDLLRWRGSVGHDAHQADPGIIVPRPGKHPVQPTLGDDHVVIHQDNRLPPGHAQALVDTGRVSEINAVSTNDERIRSRAMGETREISGRVVFRAVVHHDQFEVRWRMTQHALEA